MLKLLCTSTKTYVKMALNKIGFDIVRYRPNPVRPLNVFPLAVRGVLQRIGVDEFFFVQIGANDGVSKDPLHALIVENRLRGLLVEPLPDMFQDLTENYGSQNGLIFENAAISELGTKLKLFRFKRDAKVKDWVHGLATTDQLEMRRRAKRWGMDAQEIIEEVVPAMSFSQLLSKHNISNYNLLQIDAEGYDYKILKMALAEKVRPEIINYEHNHLSHKERVLAEVLLREMGYRHLAVGIDTLAMLSQEDVNTNV